MPQAHRARWLAAATAAVVSANAAATPALCKQDEDVVFSCVAGRKLISVCASHDWNADSGLLQYRYGSNARTEIAVPAAEMKLPPNRSASSGVLMFSGGGGAYLRFSAHDYDYVVYTAVGSSWGEKAGVTVQRDGTTRSNRFCTGAVTSTIGPELFRKAGFAEDSQGFELP